MSKLNILIILLIGFILYKGFNFNKKNVSSKATKSVTQKQINKASFAQPNSKPSFVENNTAQVQNQPAANTTNTLTPTNNDEQRANFDSLNDLNQHVEGIPSEEAAIPVEKLTPAEMEQHQISLYEQKIVSETGTVQSAPEPIKEGENE